MKKSLKSFILLFFISLTFAEKPKAQKVSKATLNSKLKTSNVEYKCWNNEFTIYPVLPANSAYSEHVNVVNDDATTIASIDSLAKCFDFIKGKENAAIAASKIDGNSVSPLTSVLADNMGSNTNCCYKQEVASNQRKIALIKHSKSKHTKSKKSRHSRSFTRKYK